MTSGCLLEWLQLTQVRNPCHRTNTHPLTHIPLLLSLSFTLLSLSIAVEIRTEAICINKKALLIKIKSDFHVLVSWETVTEKFYELFFSLFCMIRFWISFHSFIHPLNQVSINIDIWAFQHCQHSNETSFHKISEFYRFNYENLDEAIENSIEKTNTQNLTKLYKHQMKWWLDCHVLTRIFYCDGIQFTWEKKKFINSSQCANRGK